MRVIYNGDHHNDTMTDHIHYKNNLKAVIYGLKGEQKTKVIEQRIQQRNYGYRMLENNDPNDDSREQQHPDPIM